jgi:hypothetical protein
LKRREVQLQAVQRGLHLPGRTGRGLIETLRPLSVSDDEGFISPAELAGASLKRGIAEEIKFGRHDLPGRTGRGLIETGCPG